MILNSGCTKQWIELTPEMHRVIFRGKNLGSSFTDKQKAAVQSGTFDDLFLGDYWEINGIRWRIVDMDYWLGCGAPEFTSSHLVIMPDTALYSAEMNNTHTTENDYIGSAMYTTNLADARSAAADAFGDSVLPHKELFGLSFPTGNMLMSTWEDSTVGLPSEIMMYGVKMYALANIESRFFSTANKTQFALFRIAPRFIVARNLNGVRVDAWLRDVVDSSKFAVVDEFGNAYCEFAGNAKGVRPVLAVG